MGRNKRKKDGESANSDQPKELITVKNQPNIVPETVDLPENQKNINPPPISVPKFKGMGWGPSNRKHR